MIETLSWLPDAAWKSAVLLAIAWLGARLLLRQPAALRHILWSAALAGVIVMPLLSLVTPMRVTVPLPIPAPAASAAAPADPTLPPGAQTEPSEPENVAGSGTLGDPASARQESAQRAAAPVAPWVSAERLAPLALAVWLIGVIALAIRLLAGFIALRNIARAGSRSTDRELLAALENAADRAGLRAVPRLVVSDRVTMPCASGWLSPVVLLPAAAREWSADRRALVLLHELTHIKRHDFIAHLISEVARMLYWFNPLVWLASRQVRAEAERATDERVVEAGAQPSDYAGHLLDIVRASSTVRVPAPLMPLARRSEFEGRMLAILESAGMRAAPGLRAVALTIVLVAGLTATVASMGAAKPATETATLDGSVPVDDGDGTLSDRSVTTKTGPDLVPGRSASRNPATSQSDSQSAQQTTVAALAGVLDDPVPAVRKAAVEALASSRDSVAVRALMAVLLQDDNAEVRRAAAYSLGQIDDALAIPALMEALLKDADPEVRKNSAWSLGAIDNTRATMALVQALEGDRDIAVRVEVAEALSEIQDPASHAALVRALGRDDDPDLRTAVIHALQHLDNASAASAIADALRDGNPDVRVAAAEALGSFEDRSVVPALMNAARDSDVEVRRAVVEALQNIGDRRAITTFAAALTDASAEVRRSAADGLANMDNLRNAPPELIRAMEDRDADVRQSAAHALGHILDPAGLNALVAHVSDADVDVRRSVVEALEDFDEDAATAALRSALRDPDAEVRESAARALGQRSRK